MERGRLARIAYAAAFSAKGGHYVERCGRDACAPFQQLLWQSQTSKQHSGLSFYAKFVCRRVFVRAVCAAEVGVWQR